MKLVLLGLIACNGDVEDSGLFLGADPAVPAAKGEARAGVVREGPAGEAALFGGINAEGRAGDVKIYNHLAQFIVQGPYRSHGLVDIGGQVIDADLVRTDGSLGRDNLEDLFFAMGLSRLVHADRVEIESDGSDGGPAVVVSSGPAIAWDWIQGQFELDRPALSDRFLEVVTRYTLEPDSYSLEVVTELTNAGEVSVSIALQDGLLASGEDLRPWAPGPGLEGPPSEALATVLLTGRSGEGTLAMWPDAGTFEDSPITAVAAEMGVLIAERELVTLEPGESATLARYLTVAPDTAAAEAERRRVQGEELAEVSGTVTDADSGEGVAGVRVAFTGEEGVVGFALTGADGTYGAEVPPGTWEVYAVARAERDQVQLPEGAGRYGPFAAASLNQAQLDALDGTSTRVAPALAAGRSTPPAVSVEAVAGSPVVADLTVDPPSGLRVRIVDGDGEALPALLDLQWADGAPPAGEVPGELTGPLGIPDSNRVAWVWTATGDVSVPAVPGTYDLRVGHSWRHEQAAVEGIEVSRGEVVTVDVTLEQVVPEDGWLAMDSHLHGAPSFDGALAMEHRLVACAATGVDLPMTTDHDRHAEYRDLATALDLDRWLNVTPGVEVTTMIRGHFNLFPIDPRPLTEVNGGAEPWWYPPEDTEELFERIRAAGEPDALLQVNHPRSPGMFSFGSYDWLTGEPGHPDKWSWDFELFELLNGGVVERDELRRDWFSFLDLGFDAVPTGVSDSHYLFIPCGLGRTDVYLGTSTPSEVTWEELRAALVAGHTVAAAGTTLRTTMSAGGDTALPGDTLAGSEAEITATVQAPAWIAPGTLRLIRNGETLESETLEVTGEPTDHTVVWPVTSDEDAWYVVEVQGDEGLGDAWRNEPPYAAANAFRLDVDGDGWSAPGL